MRPTGEQRAVQTAVLNGESILIVQAGAGSGKTRTMQGVAAGVQHYSRGDRVLYLVYNKAMQRDAEAKFKAAGIHNTKVMTTAALSFHGVARMTEWGYDEVKARLDVPRQLPSEQAKLLQVPLKDVIGDLALSNLQIIRFALEAVDQFCYSNDSIVRAKHIPCPEGMGPDGYAALVKMIQPYAQRAWEDISRPRGGRLKLTNTHLDKLYSLAAPSLPYDLVILDEAQDTPPCYAGIVAAQADHAQLVITGDTNQQLYAWRGAVDAMTPFIEAGATVKYLSQSFRFGPVIAEEANKWLTLLRSPFLMTGNPDLRSRVGRFTEAPTAVLCWTNAAAVDEVIRFQQQGKQVHLLARGDQMRSFARAAAALQSGDPSRVTGTELAAFATWSQVQEYAEEAHGGSELKVGVKLIDTYGADGVLAAMDACVPEDQADVTVSTGHSAKGREWERVRVGDDFQEPLDTDGEPIPIPRETAMLAYVTVTRASLLLDRAGLAYVDRRVPARVPVNA